MQHTFESLVKEVANQYRNGAKPGFDSARSRCEYVTDEGGHCAVGMALHILGVSDEKLMKCGVNENGDSMSACDLVAGNPSLDILPGS